MTIRSAKNAVAVIHRYAAVAGGVAVAGVLAAAVWSPYWLLLLIPLGAAGGWFFGYYAPRYVRAFRLTVGKADLRRDSGVWFRQIVRLRRTAIRSVTVQETPLSQGCVSVWVETGSGAVFFPLLSREDAALLERIGERKS